MFLLSRDPALAKFAAIIAEGLRGSGQHNLVSGDELPPQFCAEGHLFKCWVHRILQPQVCVIHGRQGMVRMYSTSLAEVFISSRLVVALHCHQFVVRFLATDSKSSGSLPQHDSCTANPSGMIKNGKNVVSPFPAISSVQTAQ